MQNGLTHISLSIGRDTKGSSITGELNALGFGFSFFQAWLYMAIFGVATVFNGAMPESGMYLPVPLANNILYSFLGVSAIVLILLGATNQRYLHFYVSKTAIWFAAAICCAGTLAVFGACVGTQAETIGWLQIFSSILAGTLMGIGSSFLVVLWGTEFSRCDFPTIVLNATFSMAVGLVIAFLFTIWIPFPASGIVTAILPACAVLFLWRLTPVPFYERSGDPEDAGFIGEGVAEVANKRNRLSDVANDSDRNGGLAHGIESKSSQVPRGTEPVFKPLSHDLKTRISFMLRIFTPTLILGIALGALRMVCVGEILPSGNITIQLTLGAACGTSIVIFIIAIALSNKRLYWDTLFRCLTPLVAIGAAFIPFLSGDSAVVSTYFITLGFISLEVLFWVLFADISQKFRISPIFIFGIGRGILEIAAIAGSIIASVILHRLPSLVAIAGASPDIGVQNGDSTVPFVLTLLLVCSVSVGYALLPRLREIAGVVIGSKARTEAVRKAIESETSLENNVLEGVGARSLSDDATEESDSAASFTQLAQDGSGSKHDSASDSDTDSLSGSSATDKPDGSTNPTAVDGGHSVVTVAGVPIGNAASRFDSSPSASVSASSTNGLHSDRKTHSSIGWGDRVINGTGLGFNAGFLDLGSGLNMGAIPGAGLSAGVAAGLNVSDVNKMSSEAQTRAEKGSFKRRCDEISRTYVLSRREQEVLILLAKGHNAAFIQDKLCVSRSTAKTHINHIYKKLNIHTQQELLNMVEDRQRDVK